MSFLLRLCFNKVVVLFFFQDWIRIHLWCIYFFIHSVLDSTQFSSSCSYVSLSYENVIDRVRSIFLRDPSIWSSLWSKQYATWLKLGRSFLSVFLKEICEVRNRMCKYYTNCFQFLEFLELCITVDDNCSVFPRSNYN